MKLSLRKKVATFALLAVMVFVFTGAGAFARGASSGQDEPTVSHYQCLDGWGYTFFSYEQFRDMQLTTTTATREALRNKVEGIYITPVSFSPDFAMIWDVLDVELDTKNVLISLGACSSYMTAYVWLYPYLDAPIASVSESFNLFNSANSSSCAGGLNCRTDWNRPLRLHLGTGGPNSSWCLYDHFQNRFYCVDCGRLISTVDNRIVIRHHSWRGHTGLGQWVEHGFGCGQPNVCTLVTQFGNRCNLCSFASVSHTTRAQHTCWVTRSIDSYCE